MRNTVRYGIVGAGLMANEHLRNLAITPGAVVTALADPVESSIATSKTTLGVAADEVQAFTSSEALARSGLVDAVIVSSPNYTHRSVLEPLFDAGVAILCEKPIATTMEDARWVAERAAQSQAPFWVAMEYRYMPPMVEYVEQLRAGRIGKLQMLSIREHRFPFLKKIGDWNRFNRAEATRVYCSGAMDVNHKDERYDGQKPDIIDNSYTVVDFDNGVRAMLDLCMFAEGAENQEEVTAVGDKARLDVLIPEGALVFSPRVPLRAPKQVERQVVEVDETVLKAGTHHGSTFYEHQKFIAAVRGEGPVEVTAHDGLMAVAIGAAAEISSREKRAVSMSELGF